MPSLPDGETPPEDGLLPETAAHGSDERTLSLYVHVPFCSVRCGYCDFNTYTALELGPDVSQAADHLEAVREIEFAREALERSGAARRELHTVFFGGGTPTRLASSALVEILDSARGSFGLLEGAEVTTEANPDSVTREDLQTLADGGFTACPSASSPRCRTSCAPWSAPTIPRTCRGSCSGPRRPGCP